MTDRQPHFLVKKLGKIAFRKIKMLCKLAYSNSVVYVAIDIINAQNNRLLQNLAPSKFIHFFTQINTHYIMKF